jgi:hypothetical protein
MVSDAAEMQGKHWHWRLDRVLTCIHVEFDQLDPIMQQQHQQNPRHQHRSVQDYMCSNESFTRITVVVGGTSKIRVLSRYIRMRRLPLSCSDTILPAVASSYVAPRRIRHMYKLAFRKYPEINLSQMAPSLDLENTPSKISNHDERPCINRTGPLPDTSVDPMFTQLIINAMGPKVSPRMRELMASLIRHLHEFVKETRLTADEWQVGMDFLNDTGKKSDETINELRFVCEMFGLGT